jgi:phosphopantetheinyl transferase
MNVNAYIVYYTGPYTSTLLPNSDALLARVNPERRRRFERRLSVQRALDLAALRLLEKGMWACGHTDFKLADVEYPEQAGVTGKPVWKLGAVSFSISHARSIVACAIASECLVGLDVESQRRIDPRVVRRLLNDEAAAAPGLDEDNALRRWTQIEAVLKGAGIGVLHGREIKWDENSASLRGERWWVHTIDCGPENTAHVAVNASDAVIRVERYDEL